MRQLEEANHKSTNKLSQSNSIVSNLTI